MTLAVEVERLARNAGGEGNRTGQNAIVDAGKVPSIPLSGPPSDDIWGNARQEVKICICQLS